MFIQNAMSKTVCYSVIVFTMVSLSAPTTSQAKVTETLKLVPNDPAPGTGFGSAVAISQGVAVVGARNSGVGGAAYLFDTTTGQQLFKLEPDDLIADANFGRWVAVDGNLVVFGARDQNLTGAAYVFDMTTGNQVAKFVVSGGVASVAIHENTVLLGSTAHDVGSTDYSGAVLMYDVTSGNLIQTLVTDSPEVSDTLGRSVAFDGGLVATFNYNDDNNLPSIILFDPLTGDQLADFPTIAHTLLPSLAVSGDRLLVGATSTLTNNTSGIYDISDPNNISSISLPWPGQSAGDLFGFSTALSNEAALVSTWLSNETETQGSGIVYMFDPATGALLDSFRSSDAMDDDRFGTSISLYGQTLLVGAEGNDPLFAGAAYLFTIPEPATSVLFLVTGLTLLGRRQRAR